MGTSNFWVKNASKYFVVEFEENEETGEVYEFAYDDAVEDLRSLFSEKFSGDFSTSRVKSYQGEGTLIGDLTISKDYQGFEVYVRVNIIIRSGYYSGANLDYEFEFVVYDSNDEIDVDYIYRDLTYMYHFSEKMGLLRASQIVKFFESASIKYTSIIETIFGSYTDVYVRVGGFSDGTSVYTKES